MDSKSMEPYYPVLLVGGPWHGRVLNGPGTTIDEIELNAATLDFNGWLLEAQRAPYTILTKEIYVYDDEFSSQNPSNP